MTKTDAQRRWALLRNVQRATARNSLKAEEKQFLKVLSSSRSIIDKQPKCDDDDGSAVVLDENVGDIQQKVRRSIENKRSSLTVKEVTFLEQLLICPDLSVEVLMTVDHTLNTSPLFNNPPEIIYQTDEKREEDNTHLCESISSRRSSIVSLEVYNHVEEELWRTQPRSTKFSGTEDPIIPPSISENSKSSSTSKEKQPPFFSKLFTIKYVDTDESDDEKAPPQQDPPHDDDRPSTVSIPFRILGAALDDKSSWPRVLSPPLMDSLRPHMPFAVQNDNYWLKYSLRRDGGNLNTLLTLARQSHRAVLAVETFDNEVFGAFTSSPWHHGGSRFYGSGEAFVWKLSQPRKRVKTVDEMVERESDVEVFKWSRKNRNVQMSTPRQLVVGGGGVVGSGGEEATDCETEESNEWTFALTLDGDLMRGGTGCCVTFDSPHLAKSAERNDGVFEVNNVEVWTMTPVNTVDSAEKLEYGRQFIFEHGAFSEF